MHFGSMTNFGFWVQVCYHRCVCVHSKPRVTQAPLTIWHGRFIFEFGSSKRNWCLLAMLLIGIRHNVALSGPIPKYNTSVIRNITRLWRNADKTISSISYIHPLLKRAGGQVHSVCLTFWFRVTFFTSTLFTSVSGSVALYRTVPMVLRLGCRWWCWWVQTALWCA